MIAESLVHVLGAGARSHAGLDALQTALAVRAGKLRPRESHMVDRRGQPISTCRLAALSDSIQGCDRLVALAVPPMLQATWPYRSMLSAIARRPAPLAVVLALPAHDRPGFDRRLLEDILPRLQQGSGIDIDLQSSLLVTRDRGGGVIAFNRALELIEQRVADLVLVGGVDSYFQPEVLEWLDREYRLHGLETENGFIPGEGAAFLLLGGSTYGTTSLARVLGAAHVDEPRPYGSEQPCHALGMTKAIIDATGTLARARSIPWVLTDVANERHRVDEWLLALTRCFRAFTPDVRHDQPLLRTGDVGAASACMLAAIACVEWATGAAPGGSVLIAAHSDGRERGALLLSRSETRAPQGWSR